MNKRILALFLAMVMIFSNLPLNAAALENTQNQEEQITSLDLDEPEKTKPEETKPEETKPVETKPEETKPEETKPEETKPEETKPEETKPEETKPEETKPEETEPEETEPEETQASTEPAVVSPYESWDAQQLVDKYQELLDSGDEDALEEFLGLISDDQFLEMMALLDMGLDPQADDDKVHFIPTTDIHRVTVGVDGKPVTIYCLQYDYAWPTADTGYVEHTQAPGGHYANLLSGDEVQVIRRLIYAGYPSDSQGILRKHGIDDPDYAIEFTQIAIWTQMALWGKEGNGFEVSEEDIDPPLAELLEYANSGVRIDPPEGSEILIEGSGHLTVGTDGKWTTGDLVIIQPAGYKLLFTLELPEGATAVDKNGNEIGAVEEGQEFRIVTDSADAVSGEVLTASVLVAYPTEVTFYVTDDKFVSDNGNGTFTEKDYQTMLYVEQASKKLTGSLELTTSDVGSLSVTKQVAGDGADQGMEFHFTVTLNGATVNGPRGEMIFENNVAHISLKHSETKTALDLPAGITYTVTENKYDNYVARVDNDETNEATGTIANGEKATVSFVNEYTTQKYGSLTVSKTVAGNAGNKTKEFSFTVTLDDDSISGTYGDMTFEDGVATFTLKDGESKTASGLPDGTGYTVTEEADGYTATKTGDTGSIVGNDTKTAAFTNTLNTVGGLTVSKTTNGNAGDKTKEFDFTVTLGDTTINGEYGDMTFENGVATFTLADGGSKTASNLPNGTSYTVTEEADGYTATKTGDTGSIVGNQTKTAAFTNTLDTFGGLTVTKSITGNAADKTKEFNFTVTLGDTTINGTYGEMIFTDGVATFTLTDGATKTASNLPNGTSYTVTEEADGYTATKTGDTGSIVGNDTKTAAFTNTLDAFGSLTISKKVAGNAGDTRKNFEFTVNLTKGGQPVTGTYSEVAFNEEGNGKISLKHNDSKTIEGLPYGTTYTVTENADGYTSSLSANGATGTIGAGNDDVELIVTNTLNTYGTLEITKTVAGNAGSTTTPFTFTVLLKDAAGNAVSGTFGGVVFTNGEASFNLTHGQTKTISGIPNGTVYTVTEANGSYTVTKTGDTGTIVGNATKTAAFTNTLNTFGDLKVTKTVSGNAASKTKAFTFTVTLNDNTITGTYGDMTFANGVATFTLKHGESKTAVGLPNGIAYSVSESNYTGYKVTKTGDTGIILGNATKTADFTNTRNDYGYGVIPKTGDANSILTWGLMILAAGAVLTVTVLTGKRKKYSGKYSK